MSKHTKGPWALGVEGDGAVGSVYCDNALGSRVAIVYGPGQQFTAFTRVEEEANARLIAAAPELLEALILARADFAGLPHSLGYDFTHLPKIDALIARATGEQP